MRYNYGMNTSSLPLGSLVVVLGFMGEAGVKVHTGAGRVVENGVEFGLFLCDGPKINGNDLRGLAGVVCMANDAERLAKLDAAVTCDDCRAALGLAPAASTEAGRKALDARKAALAAAKKEAAKTAKEAAAAARKLEIVRFRFEAAKSGRSVAGAEANLEWANERLATFTAAGDPRAAELPAVVAEYEAALAKAVAIRDEDLAAGYAAGLS